MATHRFTHADHRALAGNNLRRLPGELRREERISGHDQPQGGAEARELVRHHYGLKLEGKLFKWRGSLLKYDPAAPVKGAGRLGIRGGPLLHQHGVSSVSRWIR